MVLDQQDQDGEKDEPESLRDLLQATGEFLDLILVPTGAFRTANRWLREDKLESSLMARATSYLLATYVEGAKIPLYLLLYESYRTFFL